VAAFEQQVRNVCETYRAAPQRLETEGIHTVCVDEKTSIQALEPKAPTKPMRPGQIERREVEYKRHGTQVLIGNFEVATGEVIAPTVQQTRGEVDFATHIEHTIATDPHYRDRSVGRLDLRGRQPDDPRFGHPGAVDCDLVRHPGKHAWREGQERRVEIGGDAEGILERCGPPRPLRVRAETHLMVESDRDLVRHSESPGDSSRRVPFDGDLRQRILKFIDYYNNTMAKPFKWTYAGRPLNV
jgi:DDE superfamily endonuclease